MNKRKQFLKLLKHSFKRSENVTVINPVYSSIYIALSERFVYVILVNDSTESLKTQI